MVVEMDELRRSLIVGQELQHCFDGYRYYYPVTGGKGRRRKRTVS